MANQRFGMVTIGHDGRQTTQYVPGDVFLDLERAMAQARELGPNTDDADCPVCAAMRAAGLEAPGGQWGSSNRTQRRAAIAQTRREARRSGGGTAASHGGQR